MGAWGRAGHHHGSVLTATALAFPVLSIPVELWAFGHLSGGEVFGLFLLQHLGFALVLPQLALRHIPFNRGIRGWFGLKIRPGS